MRSNLRNRVLRIITAPVAFSLWGMADLRRPIPTLPALDLTHPTVQLASGEAGPVLPFETVAGEWFSLERPAMSQEMEERVLEVVREVLGEDRA